MGTLTPGAAALAQDDTAAPAPRRLTTARRVVFACADEYQRFCPQAVPGQQTSGHDMALCLKFSKNDLSLSCRRAVTAANR